MGASVGECLLLRGENRYKSELRINWNYAMRFALRAFSALLLFGASACSGGAPRAQTTINTPRPTCTDCGNPQIVVPATYMVFFDWNADKLQPMGISTIAMVAADDNRLSFGHLYITAFTDTTGSSSANEKLSVKRQLAVENQLVADGVSRAKIILRPFGSRSQYGDNFQLIPTGPNVRVADNRRVEIIGDKPRLDNPPKHWRILGFEDQPPPS